MLKSSHRIAWIAGIVYFTQGSLGIVGITLPIYLRNLGWSISEITTASALVTIPWVFKILYGFLSDTLPLFGYRRKSYLILCAFFAGLGWILLAILPGEKIWIVASLLLVNIGFAATDVITDGLVVEHSDKVSSPIYQGISWGARSFGAIVSGYLGGWLAANWEPRHVFLLTVILPLIVLFAAFLLHEKKRYEMPFNTVLTPLKQCGKILLLPNLRWFMLILLLAPVDASFGIPFFFHLKETLQFPETFLGLLSSLAFTGALFGSIIYVKLLRKISPKKILFWAMLINSLNILAAFFIVDTRSALIVVGISGILSCIVLLPIMSSSAILTHHSGVEGSLFAILMSIYNLSKIGCSFVGGKLYDYVGLYPLIIGSSVIAFFAVYFVTKLDFSHHVAETSASEASANDPHESV